MSTILVVDDMAICREPIAEALRQHGFDTICASNGAEALSILRERLPDLVLLDVNMPKLDGLAVLRTIRRNPNWKTLPVVLLTDQAERETITQAAAQKVQGYLLKSNFSLDQLLGHVESAIGRTPVLSATTSVAEPVEASSRYAKWRAAIEKAPTVVAAQPRSPKLAKPVREVRSTSQAPVNSVSDLVPVITKSDLKRLVNEGLKLKPLGPTVHNVIAVTGNAGCCADDVAKAVSNDQALCIRLLKLANSSAYSRGHLVDSVKEAVQRIGIQEVRSLVMTLGVFDQFEGAAAEHVDPRLFWEHSIACGLAASALAEARHAKNVDDYFLWGMLHDVGRLILLEHASDAYASTWDAAERLGVPLELVEAKMMLLDHCDILEQALEHWQFPRDFIAPVVNHHRSIANIKRLGPAHADAAATVALANRISHALLMGSSGNEVLYPIDDFVEALKLAPAAISDLTSTLRDETRDLKVSMLARTEDQHWPDSTLHVREQLTTKVRPLCISAVPETDPYRMFCDEIAARSDEEPANLGVVYLRDANEYLPLTKKFDTAKDAGTGAATPVVLIVGKGNLDPNHPWLASRRHAVLPSPTRIAELVATMRDLVE